MASIDYSNKYFLVIDNIKPSHDVLKKFAMSLTTKPVDSTYYAQEVLPLCLEKQFDIVLLGYDLGEKQKNGQQLLEELRLSEVISRHCVVIMITAEVSQAMVLAALEHKPDNYLCKPYTVNDLKKRLDSCMKKKHAMASIYQALEEDNKSLVINLVDKALARGTLYRAECLGIKSRQFYELNNFEQAKKIYKLYQNEQNCMWANIGLGKIAIKEDELTQAVDIFKNLIELKPFYLPGYDWLASTYVKKCNCISAEETLEQAIRLSPRSVLRLKRFAQLCFDNKHFEKATSAYEKVYTLANNSIHHNPSNAISYAKSLASYSSELPISDAKKLNVRAFSMLSQSNKSFNLPTLKIQTHLLSACLLENTHDYVMAKDKIEQGMSLLDREEQNIDANTLRSIASSLTMLKRNSKASQLISSAEQQQSSSEADNTPAATKIGELSSEQLNDNYAIKAQKALTAGKDLYESKQYDESIKSLNNALLLFPTHNGIKLNLLQVLLGTFENDNVKTYALKQAKKLILDLINISATDNEYIRLKKMKKKYQQLAGI